MTEQRTAPSGAPTDGGEAAHYLELYRRMRFIRRFEEEVQSLFARGLVHGTTHLCSPRDGVIEATVTVRGRVRSRAVALRLEGLDSRWRATAIHVL